MTSAPTIVGGTVTTAVSPLSITQTWNNGAITFPGVVFNVTDTASVGTSKLVDLQVASASKFSVDKTGKITNAGDLATTGNAAITGTLGVTGNTTVTQITASTKLAASTTGVTNGCAVADATTSATTSYAPKGLGIKAYFGCDKASTLITNSADGDAIIMATTGNILMSSGGANVGFKLDTSNNIHNLVGGITSAAPTGNGVGYEAGAGGAVVQITSASTAVTLNKMCGRITTVVQSLAIGAIASFTVNNSNVAATDVIDFNLVSGNTVPGTIARVRGVAAGSFVIDIISAANTETGTIIMQFAIKKAVIT